jgi:hypothetical protein
MQIEVDLRTKLSEERQQALTNVGLLQQQMQHMLDYLALTSVQKTELDDKFVEVTQILQ